MKNTDDIRKAVLKNLWHDYYTKVPFASIVEDDLVGRNEVWIEDHIAFRTLPGPNTGSHILRRLFEMLGYKKEDDYRFDAKSLDAFWMSPADAHRHSKDASPKIFISELDLSGFDEKLTGVVEKYTTQVTFNPVPELENLFSKFHAGDTQTAGRIVSIFTDYFTDKTPWPLPSLPTILALKSIVSMQADAAVRSKNQSFHCLCPSA